jgi:protein-histidine pros-kinase
MNLLPDSAKEILKSSNEAIVVADKRGLIVFANRQAEQLFGYTAEEMTGQPIELLMPDALREAHEKHRDNFSGAPHSRPLVSGLDLKGQRKSGEVFDAEIALTPIRNDGGLLICSTIREIDAEDTSEAYFRDLLESAPDAMIIVDKDGRIAIANGQSVRMFGYVRDELIGRPIETLLPESARDAHVKHRAGFLMRPRLRRMGVGMELAGRRADGSTFPVEISLSPVSSAAGTFVSSVIRDVTERKTMERELIAARQAAERANKANTAFLAAASHDLRQPVQALSLLTGALRRTVKTPLALEMVESQQHSLDAMTNLLNSLLDISRLDAGAVTPELEDFPIQRLVDRLSAEFSRQARQKKLKFVSDKCHHVVRSDPNLLAEIFQNLVSNAIRYTDDGTVRMTFRDDGDRLWVDVRDTGIGIDETQLEEIFREFHQIKTAGTNKEGFGLGLAIVRRLADLLQHDIAVQSTPGRGSCFSIRLPLSTGDELLSKDRALERIREPSEKPGGLIVLIEDDVKVSRAWGMLLRSEGYSVVMAASAAEAFALAGELERAPDLIISDFHLLDGSTGVEAVSRIRRQFGQDLPAFIVSGDTSKVVQDARSLENSRLMSKPVNIDQLLELARKAIATGIVSDP